MARRRSRSCSSRKSLACSPPSWLGLALVLLVSALVTTGCSSSPQRPAWIEQAPLQTGWYYGVGSAQVGEHTSEQIAEKQAKKQATAQLQQSILAQIRSRTLLREVSDGGETLEQFGLTHTDISSVAMELSALRYEKFFDTKRGEVWVLASLERGQAIARLQQEARSREQSLAGFKLRQTDDPLQRLLSAGAQLDSLQRLADLEQQLRLFGAALAPSPERNALLKQLSQSVRTLSIAIAPQDVLAQSLRPGIRGHLTDAGAGIASSASLADVLLEYQLEPTRRKQNSRFHTTVDGRFQFVDNQGLIVAAFQVQGKGASSLDQPSADRKAILSINQRLADLLGRGLIVTLAGQGMLTAENSP